MNDLIANIDRLHTTKMGVERIKRNLSSGVDDVVQWCRAKILDETAVIERAGKNWYAAAGGCRITVNAHSYTIITAHKLPKPSRPAEGCVQSSSEFPLYKPAGDSV